MVNIEGMIRKAAAAAVSDWGHGDPQDLEQSLWVWYLESPATQKRIGDADEFLARRWIYHAGTQILAREALAGDRFSGKTLYSTDSVKSALKGGHDNKYLSSILPTAIEQHAARNPKQGEAIRSRYTDGVVPLQDAGHAGQMLLSRAIQSLTEEVNVLYLTTNKECVGSSSAVFPESRKRQGGYSDPTANIALALMDNAGVRDAYYEEEPLPTFLAGAAAHPTVPLGDGRSVRLEDGAELDTVRQRIDG